ncbi:MAG: HlyD family efflux transporter periplasmic adaptor subunit [Burkholderiaceae bacterium]
MSSLSGSIRQGARQRIRLAPARPVPPLREDLVLFEAAANRDGSPAWMIQDPVGNRFFRIGWIEFEMLSRWAIGDADAIVEAIGRETPLTVSVDDVEQLARFFRQHLLLRAADPGSVDYLKQAARAARPARWKWLLHNYLFIRVPLVRPQALLARLAPALGFLYTRGFLVATLAATLLGVLLAARQWDSFVHTFHDFLSPGGLLGYALALMFAKTLHEMGHAITATRLGVRVAHMGVAFLVMWPMLYTDTGESWKLSDRRKRFAIAAAGMATEFALAGFATLAWSLVDDGAIRSALFFLATTSWILTLGINASPFMRFDGYFLLSDLLDMQNLHARSFALARTRLRNALLGWNDPDPEPFEPGLRRFLTGFAILTWLYRLMVFVGIALAVYHYFFKLLGIFLFLVEIVWFVARPLAGEFSVWYAQRDRIGPPRRAALLAAAAVFVGLLAWPWARSVDGEGWLHAEQQQLIYSPFPARIARVHAEGPVEPGAALVVLDSPDTRSKAMQSRIMADALALQLDQTIGRTDGQERRAILAEQLAQQLAEFGAQQAELQRLELSAPFGGRFLDVDPQIREGVWVTANQPIGIVVDPGAWVVDALIEQKALERVAVGARARFHRRYQADAPLEGEVVAIDSARAQVLPHPMLAAENGGRIAATRQSNGTLVPRDALYRVRVRLDAGAWERGSARAWRPVELGSISIAGTRRSWLADAWTAVAAVIVRESGF